MILTGAVGVCFAINILMAKQMKPAGNHPGKELINLLLTLGLVPLIIGTGGVLSQQTENE